MVQSIGQVISASSLSEPSPIPDTRYDLKLRLKSRIVLTSVDSIWDSKLTRSNLLSYQKKSFFHFKIIANEQQLRSKPKKPLKNQRLPSKGKTFQQPRPMTHYEEEERHWSNHECCRCIRRGG